MSDDYAGEAYRTCLQSERDGPTCEIGFWAQVTRGCPLCHPGPCKLGYDLPMDIPSRWPPLFAWVVLVGLVVGSLAGKS